MVNTDKVTLYLFYKSLQENRIFVISGGVSLENILLPYFIKFLNKIKNEFNPFVCFDADTLDDLYANTDFVNEVEYELIESLITKTQEKLIILYEYIVPNIDEQTIPITTFAEYVEELSDFVRSTFTLNNENHTLYFSHFKIGVE